VVNGCCISFAGLNQRYGSQCFNDPRDAGEYRQPNAANALVSSKYGKSDAAHTVDEHRQPDAADTLASSKYGKSDAAHTVDEHRQPDAADALEVVRAGSAQAD